MAVNLEALQKKLNQLSGQNSRKNVMWRPPEGEETAIRIIAFPDNDGQPFKERYFYYGIGSNPGLLAPYQFGKPDPFQDLINKLRSDDTKESYELAKKLYPKMRSYAAVIVRGEEDRGVRLWSFGKMVYQDLLKIMLDSDYGDITDVNEGFDIKVSCQKQPGRKWAETSVRPRPKATALSSDKKQIKEWKDNIPDLDEMYSCKSHDELEKIINAWLEDPNDSEGSYRGTSSSNSFSNSSSNTQGESSSQGSSSTIKDLDAAFADLENL
mgnify:CR=1 FL=1|tara:strand:+ start:3110 stop:3913 length:804 start_codon:yes stop_codon:yes gene_type:complete